MTSTHKRLSGGLGGWAYSSLSLLLCLGACGGSGGTAADASNVGGTSNVGGASGAAGKTGMGGSGGSAAGSGGNGGAATKLPFDASDLQLNDVSILFPVSTSFSETAGGLLELKAKGPRGELLPSALYSSVGPISGGGESGPAPAAYESLRVVGARIDPCFASLAPAADGAGCKNELRLVVQQIVKGAVHDSAMHLFYEISREEMIDLVETTAGLRQSLKPKQRLGRLQPHPIMVEQGPKGSMAAGVNAAIVAHAGAANLIRITTMSSDGSGNPTWKFAGFDVKNGVLAAIEVFGLPAGSKEQSVQQGTPDRNVHPLSGSTDAFAALLNNSSAQALSKTDQAAMLKSLRRVEDPAVYSPETIDCVTCHLATPVMKLVVERTLGLSSDSVTPSFKADSSLVPAGELEPSYDSPGVGSVVNVHSFSYVDDFGGHNLAGISQRTVNETAAVVSYLSHDVLSGK